MTLRLLPIMALSSLLAACGAAVPATPSALRALNDCPSCGTYSPVTTEQFWAWAPGAAKPRQVWTTSETRMTRRTPEVYLRPEQDKTNAATLSVGCLFPTLHAGVRGAFRVTPVVDAQNIRRQDEGDALCARHFGVGWHMVTPAAASDLPDTWGFWAEDHRNGGV